MSMKFNLYHESLSKDRRFTPLGLQFALDEENRLSFVLWVMGFGFFFKF